MIYKWLRDDLAKLSYISEVKFTGTYVYLHYGEDKIKRLSYRTNRPMLLNALESIREELEINDIKTELVKHDFNVAFTEGEKNE